jgi:uncharacterized protein (DUF58 family)
MSEYLFPFLVVLTLLAFFLRDNFVLTLLYLFVGVLIFSRIWRERAVKALSIRRVFTPRIFFGEEVDIRLEVRNSGWLPLVWVRLIEGLPSDLSLTSSFRRVVSLTGRSQAEFHYKLVGRRRGFYPIGPISLQTGDIFGLAGSTRRLEQAERLIVYPKIIPLPNFSLSSSMPLGTMRFIQPIYEDPSRVMGKRPYADGDSLRRVDWKATAQVDQLQVKLFEPSITIEAALFVNLNPDEYYARQWVDSTELAVVAAASIAHWLVGKRQAVGLATNGRIANSSSIPPFILPRKGRPHLIRVLGALAGIEVARANGFAALVRQKSVQLPWGTTIVVVTGGITEALLDELLHVRQRGIQVMALLVGPIQGVNNLRLQMKHAGIVSQHIYREEELKELGRWI